MTSHQVIRQTFQRMGYPPGTFIRQDAFYSLLNKMTRGEYDQTVAQQLWDQASMGSDRDVRIEELSDIIADAQRILNGKIQETHRDLSELSNQKRRIMQSPMNQRDKQNQIRKLEYEIEQAKKDLIQYEQDLRFVTTPFQPNRSQHFQNNSYQPQFQGNLIANNSLGPIGATIGQSQYPIQNNSGYPLNNQSQYNQSLYQDPHQNLSYFDSSMVSTASINQDLKIVLWIAIAIGILQIIIMYKKFDFLNLLIIVTLLSIFLLDYFDATYIKVCIGLIFFSIILDIVWLSMYASTFWSPPLVSQHNQGQIVYLRFIVLFTVIILIIKMPLVILLLKYRDVPANTNFTVPVYGKTQLNVVSNKGNNLISQGCSNLITLI